MNTIVFIGTQKSGSSREAIKAAEKLGYYTVLLTNRTNFLEKHTEFPDVHYMILCDINNMEAVESKIKELVVKALDVHAVVSFVDPYCYTACIISEKLGLNHFTTNGIYNMIDKINSRKILSGTPYAPYFTTINESSLPEKLPLKTLLPFMIKSPNSNGSKDVIKINSFEEFIDKTNMLFNKYPNTPILIEEFLDGEQYLIETITFNNEIHIIAVIHQEISFNKRFIITGYSLMLNLPEEFYTKLKEAVEYIVRAHGMEYGPCHLEMRYVNENWKLVEVNPRISGAGMNKLIEIATGINLVKETLKMLLNKEANLKPKFRRNTFAQYITVSKKGVLHKVTGKHKAYKCAGVKHVYVKPRKGTLLTPPLSMGNRYAYVIATGENEEVARENAKYAASLINFSLIEKEGKITKITYCDGFYPSCTPYKNPISIKTYTDFSEDDSI